MLTNHIETYRILGEKSRGEKYAKQELEMDVS